jgi:nucleoside phosphorylase
MKKGTRYSVKMRNVDVLLVTVAEIEARAILSLFPTAQSRHIGNQTYHDLGSIGGAEVFMVQSEMGSGGQSGSILTIQEAIDALHPTAVVMVGIAFGINQSKHQIGDILVSKQIVEYEPQRMGTGPQNEPTIFPRGDRSSAPPRMLSMFRAASLSWQAPPKVEFGLVLSGDKLVDNQDFRNQLLSREPEAIGGEMEGAGLYAVTQRQKVDWILVKAICDWADGNKHQDERQHQRLAAKNAARFTVHVLNQGGFKRTEPEIAETDASNNDKPKPTAEQYLADLKRRLELTQKRASEQGQQGNDDTTMQGICDNTINMVRKSLM